MTDNDGLLSKELLKTTVGRLNISCAGGTLNGFP